MVPLQTGGELLGSYSDALAIYLRNRQPAHLLEARELGRAALIRGVEISELCHIHHQGVARVLPGLRLDPPAGEAGPPQPSDGRQDVFAALGVAGTFLAESVAPFDADRREVSRSNSALRRYNQKLEDELYRLTRIVYDDALQLLAAARLAMAGSMGKLQPATCEQPAEFESLLDQVHDHLAACSTGLLPRVLFDLGLGSAIESLCRRLSKTAAFDLQLESAIDALPGKTSIAIYRTVVEALGNIQQHAMATRVTLRLHRELHRIHFLIGDNGIGFDAPAALRQAHERGSGLAIMAEILRSVGARLTVESAPAAGTMLKISLAENDATW